MEILDAELTNIRLEGNLFFDKLCAAWEVKRGEGNVNWYSFESVSAFATSLSNQLQSERNMLEAKTAAFSAHMLQAIQSSSISTVADETTARLQLRKLISAYSLRRYSYHEASAIQDEDRVFGVTPASHSETYISAIEAREVFDKHITYLQRALLLTMSSGGNKGLPTQVAPSVTGSFSAPDTAFIMMWMSDEHPELEDVKIAIQEVFAAFGIRAVRADDIEHEELITERVTAEIRKAEFLIADLTGARPNVYYEVGFAHALGKRPILYRKKDSVLHFDLAGRNVPTYANLHDLKQKLTLRLEAILGRPSKVGLAKPSS